MTTIIRTIVNRRLRSDDRGATLVEFALVSFVYFLIVFGTMEFGRMIFDYNIVSTVTRDGARWASVRGNASGRTASPANVKDYVVSRSLGLLEPSDVTVTWPTGNDPGDTVEITAQYTFTPTVPLLPQTARTLSSTARMIIVR
jgi:Flp pilus assembly protein TadG